VNFIDYKVKVDILINILLLSIIALIQACSSARIGEQLSQSFDEPEVSSQKKPALKKDLLNTNLNNKKSNNQKSTKKKKEKVVMEKRLTNKKKNIIPRIIKFTPKPYRITIKLSGANPSSPSESVTNALIKAGVVFEVEKIESLEVVNDINNMSKKGLRR
tara:strand:+ start:185 stop:664 length:480 start_codon:yes stop_codon:yes gene_type:complete